MRLQPSLVSLASRELRNQYSPSQRPASDCVVDQFLDHAIDASDIDAKLTAAGDSGVV